MMKKSYSQVIWRFLPLVLIISLSILPVVSGAEITIQFASAVDGGDLVFQLFDTPNTFGDFRDPVYEKTIPATGASTCILPDVPAGEYALLVFHDKNTSGDLDKNFIGIPREPVGFSRGYRPTGPPAFDRAKFQVSDQDMVRFNVELTQPLGKRGRIGVGVGVIARSSPYREYHGNVTQGIPAITFIGNRVQIFGPRIQVGLARWEKFSVAAGVQYRIGVYEDKESPYLDGMGDRKNTLMAGVNMQYKLPLGFNVHLGYAHDVLDRIGGGAARLSVGKSFQLGIFRFSPQAGLRWFSSTISNHDFGVPVESATEFRPAYRLDDTFNVEFGLGTYVEITRKFAVILSFSVELLDDDIKNSPIVDEDYVVNGFMAVNYVF